MLFRPPSSVNVWMLSGLRKFRFDLSVGHISSIASPESTSGSLARRLPCSTKLTNSWLNIEEQSIPRRCLNCVPNVSAFTNFRYWLYACSRVYVSARHNISSSRSLKTSIKLQNSSSNGGTLIFLSSSLSLGKKCVYLCLGFIWVSM